MRHHLDPSLGDGGGEPLRQNDVPMVEPACDERAWKWRLAELVPDRLHGARAHAAKRAGEPSGVVVEALGSDPRDVVRTSAFEPCQQRQSDTVRDERLDALYLD